METKEIKEKLQEMVPDFAAKVKPIYNLLRWEWSPGKSEPHIPAVSEIENALYGLIEDLTPASSDQEYEICGTGGLEVYYERPTDEQHGRYGLRFVLDEGRDFD